MALTVRERVAFLRYSGQYEAALRVLADASGGDHWVLCERAMCHFMRHEFEEVAFDYARLASLETLRGSREEAILTTVYDLSRVHTDLALKEAVQTSEANYTAWLKGKSPDTFEDEDLSLLYFCHTILGLGRQLLSDSTEEIDTQPARLPTQSSIDTLRARFLRERRPGPLVMVHQAEAVSTPLDHRISRILETIDITTADDDIDLRVHLEVLLAQTYREGGETARAIQGLMRVRSPPYSGHNPEAQWWAQYYLLRVGGHENKDGLGIAEHLSQVCSDRGARNAALLCGFLEAEMYLKGDDEERYSEWIKVLLEQSHHYHMPPRDVPNGIQGREPKEASTPPQRHSYSSFGFWLQYLQLLKEDMNSRTRLGLALLCPTRFFERHSECSIPQLKFTLASSLVESYEDCGDVHAALHWAAREKAFAEEADDQTLSDEARFDMGFLMAEDCVKVAADPDGVQLAGWRATQRVDLEVLHEEAGQKGLVDFQFRCASMRLDKELDDEVGRNETPRGEVWLARTLEAVARLPEARRDIRTQQVKYKLAHSKLDFGDYRGAADALDEVVALAEKNHKEDHSPLLAQVLFTKARAHLHEYMTSRSPESWDLCLAALTRSLSDAESQKRIDEAACCHVLAAVAWHTRGCSSSSSPGDDEAALATALRHISEVRRLWDEESRGMASLRGLGLDGLLLRYSLRGRNESVPYAALGLAVETCFRTERFEEAWGWVEYAKARAFAEELAPEGLSGPDPEDALAVPDLGEPAVVIHWAFVGDRIYMITYRQGPGVGKFRMFRLDITTSAVEEWYQGLVASKEDLGVAEDAEELLSELSGLCAPLFDPDVTKAEELLIFCPTGVLFKIPLHAIPVEGVAVLERNPVVYTYSSAVLARCMQRATNPATDAASAAATHPTTTLTFLGNPTGDTPAGERSVRELAARLGGECYTGGEATKVKFRSSAAASRLVHFHGHVSAGDHPQQMAMLFPGGDGLRARDVFAMEPRPAAALAVVLIGCGSGAERLATGDEPVGLVSAFLHAGAGAVVATLWPISDGLSGAAFSDVFYGVGDEGGRGGGGSGWGQLGGTGRVVDLAWRLRTAALAIKAREATAAPYFWAGFVVHGNWRLVLDS